MAAVGKYSSPLPITDGLGNPQASVTVTVLAGGYPAPLYTSAAGTTLAAGNTVTSDANGNVVFYAQAGTYVLSWPTGTRIVTVGLAELEAARALNAEALLAPAASPTLTGVVTEPATNTAGGAAAAAETLANGTAAQLSQLTKDCMLYFQVGTAGTAGAIAIGPTAGVANTLVTGAALTSGQVISIRVPAGWYVKWSATTATMASITSVTC